VIALVFIQILKLKKSAGETWLRGFQKTDEKGEAKFTSIFPGWYNNRLTHIHFKVHHNGETKLTSNLFFDKEVEAMVFKNPLYANGVNPVTMAQDYELRGDKDSSRHDKLIMKVGKQGGKLVGKYTVALSELEVEQWKRSLIMPSHKRLHGRVLGKSKIRI
jgi:protocatechuate 3,4-dioxygenase beta subunit